MGEVSIWRERGIVRPLAERVTAMIAFIACGFAVGLLDRSGATQSTTQSATSALAAERAESASAGVGLLVMLLLGVIHLILIVAFANRWRSTSALYQTISSGAAGAGSYLLLLGAIFAFRPTYSDPLQSTWIFAVLLGLPAVVTTIIVAEVVHRISNRTTSSANTA